VPLAQLIGGPAAELVLQGRKAAVHAMLMRGSAAAAYFLSSASRAFQLQMYAFELYATCLCAGAAVQAGGQQYSPSQIGAFVLTKMKETAGAAQ
jgi:hypothetical protein